MENYDILSRIGKGACGAVYLTRHHHSKKVFALKKIQLDDSRKNRTKDAVLKEAKILAELKHPNIVAYHDSFFDEKEEYLCILQDYCDGGTMDDKIADASKKKEFFPEKQIMQWFIQIAMAVQYMHSKKILHRDLKSQNVFMTKTGMTCKLGDFGISKMMDQTIDVASTCVGTPCYLSPEMCQDIPYSSKADIWALGCLLYEMCALKPAFDAHNLISLFYKIVKGEHEPIPAQYSKALCEVVKAVLQKSPEDRPSARQVINLPYVKEMLSSYITEKEYLIQLKAAKDSPALERRALKNSGPGLSPMNLSRSSSVEPNPVTSPFLDRKKAPSAPLPSTLPVNMGTMDSGLGIDRHSQSPPGGVEKERHICKECGKSFRMKSWLLKHKAIKHGGEYQSHGGDDAVCDIDYQDDFENSDSSESELDDDVQVRRGHEDIPEDLPDGVARDGSDTDEPVEEDELELYDDDFEDYASDDNLDEIVMHAKELQADHVECDGDEVIVDHELTDRLASCKNLIQEHCLATLGKEKFNLVRQNCLDTLKEEDVRQTFEFMDGTEHRETCYLVSELLNSPSSAEKS